MVRQTFGQTHYYSRDRNWEVQAGSPDKIFDKKMSICLTEL
jgi:hypothetical protein